MQNETAKQTSAPGPALISILRQPVLLLTMLFLMSSAAFCQLTTADILGAVTDSTGAVVPNAAVVLTNIGTNEKRTATTNSSGEYSFNLLPVGHYSIEVKAGGFQAAITKDLAVEAGDRARNDVHLTLGSESTIVEVTASTPLLQADSKSSAGSPVERS
jgi:Carboxypeptidase regulatory-like domain